MRTPRVDATIFGTASLLALPLGGAAPERLTARVPVASVDAAALVGSWLSPDRTVRLQLGADGSYRGSVEGRHRPATGTYRPEGAGLVLRDDSGLRTPVTVAGHRLEMAGHQLFKA
jgi:hypothetical protein